MMPVARIILFVLIGFSIQGQQLLFRNYTTRDGLLSNVNYYFFQDSEGYLWISTESGLSRFDGKNFKNFEKTNDGQSISSSFCITQTSNGHIWVGGYGNGLFEYNGEKFVRHIIGSNPKSNYINDLLETNPNELLICTENGLYKFYNNKVIDSIPDADNKPLIIASTGNIVKDSSKHIYILYNGKLWNLDPECKVISEALSHAHKTDYYSWMNLLHDGRLIIGSVENQMIYISKQNSIEHSFHLSNCRTGYAIDDLNGFLWISTNKGFFKTSLSDPFTKGNQWFRSENGLPTDMISMVFLDREHNLWFGSYGKGIYKLTEPETYRFEYPYTSALGCADLKGRLWISTPEGIRVISKSLNENSSVELKQQQLHPFPDKYFKTMGAIQLVGENQLWLGCDNGTLVNFEIIEDKTGKINLKYLRELSPRNGFPLSMSIWIFIDREGRLWYSELNKNRIHVVDISSNNPVLVKTITYEPGTNSSNRRDVFEDEKGNFWIAYGTNKILILNSDLSLHEKMEFSTSGKEQQINCIFKEPDGKLWLGTNSDGILYITPDGKRIQYNKSSGLLSNRISRIVKRDENTFWIATWNGIAFVYHQGDSIRLDENRELTQSPIWSLGIFPDSTGWFATNFEVVLHKKDSSRRAFFPPAVLHKVIINGKERTFDIPLQLTIDENDLVFEYGSVCLQSRVGIRYSYKLEGNITSDWSQPSEMESVNYAGLKPGSYIFLVKAITTDGLESLTPASFEFTIIPPFWQKWWFIVLCFIVASTIVWFLVILRIRRLVEIERLRARIAADLHDDIGSGLSRIALATDMLIRQKADATNMVNMNLTYRIGKIARELIESMGDIVWAIDPLNDSLSRVIDLIRVFANDICEAKDINCQFAFDPKALDFRLGSEVVLNFILIAKEAIHNAAVHSSCKNIRIEIKSEQKDLQLSIIDDGIGFNENELERINGLNNMKRRAEKINGTLKIMSSRGTGTEILFNLHLPR